MEINDFSSYIFFPGQHWSHTWERQHEIITRFAELLNNKELYVCSPLGLLNHNPFSKDFFRRIRKYNDSQESILIDNQNPIRENMRMINKHHIPFHYKITGWLNFQLLRDKLHFDQSNNFFWSTYMNPTLYEFFKRSTFKIYDIAERRKTNPKLTEKVKDWEKRAVSEADLVVTDNHAVLEDYKSYNVIHYIPQGVNVETFHTKIETEKREYIGYIGNLHFAIDYNLFEKLIVENPSEKFMIIGGILEPEGEKLIKHENVIYIPQVPKEKLNDYLAKMKIGLIPYIINDHTIGVYPTKLFEYLAAGVPVISTNLPEVAQYANDNYLRIIGKSLDLSSEKFNLKGITEIIDDNTWNARWAAYTKLISNA